MDSKIRIAVSLSGMARHSEECYKNTLEFFDANGCEVDFFIHSWASSWYPARAKSQHRSPDNAITVPIQELTDCLEHYYNPKKILVEDQLSNIDLKNAIKSIRTKFSRKTSRKTSPDWLKRIVQSSVVDPFLSYPFHLGQTYSISKSASLVSEYSKENNFQYDLVFRFRFDNFMELKTKEHRTQLFKDMDTLIKRDYARSQDNTRFKREHLFTAWTTVFGDCGYSEKSVWIGDKIFACSGRVFSRFENYFRSQLLRILSYNTSMKNVSPEKPYFMPEHLLAHFCLENDFWACSQGQLNTFSLASYRPYHQGLQDQSFDSIRLEYNRQEKNNHDGTKGIFIDYDN